MDTPTLDELVQEANERLEDVIDDDELRERIDSLLKFSNWLHEKEPSQEDEVRVTPQMIFDAGSCAAIVLAMAFRLAEMKGIEVELT